MAPKQRACENCNDVFLVQNRTSKKKYCSPKCAQIGFKAKTTIHPERTCKHCKMLYPGYPNKLFCSHECKVAYGIISSACLNCGKTFEHKRYKARKYCSNACVGVHTAPLRSNRTDVMCAECGVTFSTPVSQSRTYCSMACQKKVYERKRAVSNCIQCGAPFASLISSDNKFCSQACYARSMEVREIRNCEQCSKSFTCRPCEPMRYCSVACAWESFKVENSHSGYGPDWPHIRNTIRERDNYCCVHCGIPEKDRAHDVHHLTPLRSFDGDLQLAHAAANLVTLCRSCHSSVEAGTIVLLPDR